MKQFFLNLIDSKNTASLTRFVALLVILNVMIVWTAVCLKNMGIADIPPGVQVLIGTVMLAKVGQSFSENKNDKTE